MKGSPRPRACGTSTGRVSAYFTPLQRVGLRLSDIGTDIAPHFGTNLAEGKYCYIPQNVQ